MDQVEVKVMEGEDQVLVGDIKELHITPLRVGSHLPVVDIIMEAIMLEEDLGHHMRREEGEAI